MYTHAHSQVGHVVHSNTEWFEGSPNKNIGDAFLLVWKMSKMCQRRINAAKRNKRILMTNLMRKTAHAAASSASTAAASRTGEATSNGAPVPEVELLEPVVIRDSTRKRGDTAVRWQMSSRPPSGPPTTDRKSVV